MSESGTEAKAKITTPKTISRSEVRRWKPFAGYVYEYVTEFLTFEPLLLQTSYSLKAMERWSGRVALVTGGSSGIGAAIVRRLVSHGLKVVACGRQVDRIEVNNYQLEKFWKTVAINKKFFNFHRFCRPSYRSFVLGYVCRPKSLCLSYYFQRCIRTHTVHRVSKKLCKIIFIRTSSNFHQFW